MKYNNHRYYDKRSDYQKFDDALRKTSVKRYTDQREIFETALSYCYGQAEKPIEFREQDIKAILVNSIRHSYTDYNKALKDVHRVRKNKEYTYRRYKNAVLSSIAEQYPYLESACDKQKYNVPMVQKI